MTPRLFLFLFAGLTSAALLVAGVTARPASEALLRPTQSPEQARVALQKALADAKTARYRSERLETTADALVEAADKAAQDARAMAARVQESEADIRAAEARINLVAALQRQQRARLAVRQEPMVRLTGALQMLSRRPVSLSLIQPGSVRDMVHVRAVMDTAMPHVARQTAGLRAEVARGKRLRSQAEQAANLLRTSRDKLETRRTQLAAIETQRRVAARDATSTARLEEGRAMALSEEARDITDLMGRMEAGADRRESLAALEGPVLRPGDPGQEVAARETAFTPRSQPAYRLPVIGDVAAGLGETSDSGYRARGLSIVPVSGAQVVAPADGRIAFAGPYRGFGNILIIEHGGGWTSLITGLGDLDAQVGDMVDQGAPVANAADDDPLVTIELRRAGRPIDIIPLLGS